MDRLDRKILRLLQEDSTLAVADVAKKVGLSTTPCWRRIQKLEEEGVKKFADSMDSLVQALHEKERAMGVA